jgi:hypothetical protein
MKRVIASIAFVALVVLAGSALAEVHSEAHQGVVKTVSGEVVDMGCYLAHAARGEKHVSCGTKCVANGMPMGLLTADGTLYIVTLNHDDPDPYNALKKMVGKNATITGTVMTRNGIKGIDVTGAKVMAAAAR